MFLSIIIPVWNDEKYIEECLDSCLNQDIPVDDYEIICVDDGSTDSTPEILNRYASNNLNLKVIIKQHGAAYGNGRNIGLDCAAGNYVWFVDHDDVIRRNCLSELKRITEQTSCERLTFSCYAFHTEMTEEELKKRDQDQLPGSWAWGDNVVWTSIIKRQVLLDNDIFPRSKRLGDKAGWSLDTMFIYEVKQHVSETTVFKDYPLYYYRILPTSQDHQTSKDTLYRKVVGISNMVELYKQDYDNSDEKDEASRQMIADTMLLVYRKGLEALAQLPQPEFKEITAMLRSKGLLPMRIPKEATYTWRECAKENSGTGPIRNILRFYSVYPMGLKLAAMPHCVHRLKVRLSRLMRNNHVLNALLNAKNKLLRR